MIRFPRCRDPLLPRPMSICNVLGDDLSSPTHIQILHKVVGRGTAMLSTLTPGDAIQVLGPLGQPFQVPQPEGPASEALMVAGGIGVAIFPFLVDALRKKRWTPVLLFGGRRAQDLVKKEWFEQNRVAVRSATEDGSMGRKGLVTDLLREALDSRHRPGVVYACGPQPMLKAVGHLVGTTDVPAQVSLECYMGCGIGACLGCVVKKRRAQGFEYVRVCVEGPTLDAREVLWD